MGKELCTYTYHLQYLKNLPTCEISGRFAAKQCFGDMVSGRLEEHNNSKLTYIKMSSNVLFSQH